MGDFNEFYENAKLNELDYNIEKQNLKLIKNINEITCCGYEFQNNRGNPQRWQRPFDLVYSNISGFKMTTELKEKANKYSDHLPIVGTFKA